MHYTEPTIDRIANIRIATEFTPRNELIVRPRQRCGPFVKPGAVLVTDGEKLPLAAGPLGGMGDFYTARYGEYLIGMNCTKNKTFQLLIPPAYRGKRLTELISNTTVVAAETHPVRPRTTAVFHLAPAGWRYVTPSGP